MNNQRMRIMTVLVALGMAASACGSVTDALVVQPIATEPVTSIPVAAPSTILPLTTVPSTTGPSTTGPAATTVPVQDTAVAASLERFTDWAVPTVHSIDDRTLAEDDWSDIEDDGTKTDVSCGPRSHPQLSKTFQQFPAFGFSGAVVPGLIVEGGTIEDGDLQPLPLQRAPLTLTSSLASANPVRQLDAPDSASLASAVAELKRDADARLTNLDVVPSDISYVRTESHSFEQSLLDMEVSARYGNRLASAGLDASFTQETSVEKHTISVRLIQPMYTIRAAADAIANPGDHFADTVTASQVDDLVANGSIGPSSPPMIIDEVTYGRVMYFTMTSVDSTSATDMWLAVEAAKGKASGSASITAEQERILSSSQISMEAFGGAQGDALSAIKTGDLNAFFNDANTTQAAELSFSLRTLDGNLVEVSDTADVQAVLCDRSPVPYHFTANITGVNGRVRLLVNDVEIADVRSTPNNILTIGNEFRLGSESVGGSRIDDRFGSGANEIEIKYLNPDCLNAQFAIEINVDGVTMINEGRSQFPIGYCGATWIYDVNPLTGTVTEQA